MLQCAGFVSLFCLPHFHLHVLMSWVYFTNIYRHTSSSNNPFTEANPHHYWTSYSEGKTCNLIKGFILRLFSSTWMTDRRCRLRDVCGSRSNVGKPKDVTWWETPISVSKERSQVPTVMHPCSLEQHTPGRRKDNKLSRTNCNFNEHHK